MRRSRENEKIEMKRDERKDVFSRKKVSRPSNPPDELAQKCFEKKSPSDEVFLHFSSKVQNLTVFSIIYMIRIRFFGPEELIKRTFRREQYVCPAVSVFSVPPSTPTSLPSPRSRRIVSKSSSIPKNYFQVELELLATLAQFTGPAFESGGDEKLLAAS